MDEQGQGPSMNEAFRVAAARAAIAVSFAALVGVGAFGAQQAQQAHQARQADMDHGRVQDAPVAPALVPAGTVLTHAPDHLRAVPLPEDFNLEILGDSPTGS
jgi:hypothetical protein